MLSPYNILYPYRAQIFKEDPYVQVSTKMILDIEQAIIFSLKNMGLGKVILPSIIKSISDTEFVLENFFGEDISNTISRVHILGTWYQVDASGPFDKSLEWFTEDKTVLLTQIEQDPNLFQVIFSKNIDIEGKIHTMVGSNKYLRLLQERIQVTFSKKTEDITDISQERDIVSTDTNTYNLKYPLAFSKEIGDSIPIDEPIDSPVNIEFENQMLIIHLKKAYQELQNSIIIEANHTVILDN